MHTLGKVLQELRKQKNISKQQLCKRTNFNQGYIYRLENDIINPSIQNLELYCKAIEVPLWQVILYTDRIRDRDNNYKISLSDFGAYGFVADSENTEQ